VHPKLTYSHLKLPKAISQLKTVVSFLGENYFLYQLRIIWLPLFMCIICAEVIKNWKYILVVPKYLYFKKK